ncbi:MAG: hypothetical protein WBO57_10040, partial [Gammaproteobacteria bacterium]
MTAASIIQKRPGATLYTHDSLLPATIHSAHKAATQPESALTIDKQNNTALEAFLASAEEKAF